MNHTQQELASDNYAGACPEAIEYLLKANEKHEISYGDDSWTRMACDRFRTLFETDCDVFFVFNGTSANSLALATLCAPYHSIICHETGHVETDECGAPEFFSNGAKLLLAKGENGKISPDSVTEIVNRRIDIHYPRPHVLSLTQATELGTVYTREELLALCARAKQHHLKIHMDGSRLANALAFSRLKPREVTWECGVDVLCFGGTKNGLPIGEAIIFFDKELSREFAPRCKQCGQLASKMRFLSAPWLGLLETGAWLRNAQHANAMAERLEQGLRKLPNVKIMFPRQANSVFVTLPPPVIEKLHALGWHFYTFIGVGGARLMCSWDVKESSVDAFLADLRALLPTP